MSCESNEDDVIREVVDRQAAYIAVIDTRNESAGRGKLLEMLKCLANFTCEAIGYLIASVTVPICRLTQLAAGPWS